MSQRSVAMKAALVLLSMAFSTAAAAATAVCTTQVREFALLAQMNMAEESLAAYTVLQRECELVLRLAVGEELPAAGDVSRVLLVGRKLHAQSRDASARQVVKALNESAIPAASAEVLRGLGPENAWRALGGMAFDVLGAGLESRQRTMPARKVLEVGDIIRGDEQRWVGNTSSPTNGFASTAPAGYTKPQHPEISMDTVLPSCSGSYDFLAPRLRAYTASLMADARRAVLEESAPRLLAAAKQQAGSKAEALRQLREQLGEFNRVANESAQTANQTDGRGDARSISMAVSDTLELGYPCGQGSSVHVAAVCNFILMRWGSLGTRASIAVVDQCWQP